MGTMPAPQKRMSLLEFLIDNQLFAEAAEGAKLDQGADFDTRLNYLKRRALRELYFEKVIKASVSDADARKIYDDQVKLLKPEEEVSARHILVETEEQAKALKEKLNKRRRLCCSSPRKTRRIPAQKTTAAISATSDTGKWCRSSKRSSSS